MEIMNNPDVAALQSLCDKEGGFKVVADAIGVNNQSIYQILTFVKLPSGRPKGIGPQLREKLDARYPGWSNRKTNPSTVPASASEMARRLAAAFDRIPSTDPIRQSRAFSAAFSAIEKELGSD